VAFLWRLARSNQPILLIIFIQQFPSREVRLPNIWFQKRISTSNLEDPALGLVRQIPLLSVPSR
jgi:hypothetical protein